MMQCLAMPVMRHSDHADLAQSRYLDDASFIGYLKYLQYWHEPQYARYVMCVACLIIVAPWRCRIVGRVHFLRD